MHLLHKVNAKIIRLANPRDKSIDLGSVPVSKIVTKKIIVVNEGQASLDLRFDLLKNLNGRDDDDNCPSTKLDQSSELMLASVRETKRSWTLDRRLGTREPLLSNVLRIKPSAYVTLKPNRQLNVSVVFSPIVRMRPFVAKVAFQTSSTILPLFVVRGSCVGAEFRLNRTHIPFGTVVQGCAEETKVVLMNSGDLGSRFKWNASSLAKDFQISPLTGYCSPGMDVSFLVRFQPMEEKTLVDCEATIEIEKYESQTIRITGGCCKLPNPVELIRFESFVRENQTREIVVMNDKNLPWKLKAEVTGDHFTVEEMLPIPPQGFGSCVVTYAPLVMNTEHEPHKGTLLLKCSEQSSILVYSLEGRSLPPNAAGKITRRFPAKMKYTELLPVHNWTNSLQRFRCSIDLLVDEKDRSEGPVYSFTGNERIDVPANNQRDYRAAFFCYTKSSLFFKVTFTNEDQEYQFYEIEYEVTEPELIESVKLSTEVRSPICATIKLENPLEDDAIEYTVDCSHPFITIANVPRILSPLSHEYVCVQYLPLLPAEETIPLIARCRMLGEFPYELRLKATRAAAERVTRVNATLGSAREFVLSLRNYTKETAKFQIEVDNAAFVSPDVVQVNGDSSGAINMIYEPCGVENVTGTLTATSETAGEFLFPLIGGCSPPKPVGPYVIDRSSPAVISFKNVFNAARTFDFLVDVPESFAIKTESATLQPKQSIGIEVRIREIPEGDDPEEEKYPVTGKLTVFCNDPALSRVNWVYYLRGIFR